VGEPGNAAWESPRLPAPGRRPPGPAALGRRPPGPAAPGHAPPAASPEGTPPAAEVMARAGGENFPVASRLLPRRYRNHLLAIYGFARLADTLGDESPGDRLAQLDWLDGELDRAAAGAASHPLLRRLTPTIEAFALPLEPFRALIDANRLDQRRVRYETFDDLLGYCDLSAAPVGQLVLAVFEAATTDRLALSDRVCAALQVAEHLQDLGEDARRGRVYLPVVDLQRFGVTEDELLAPHASTPLRRLVAFEAERARTLLFAGHSLVADLHGWARVAVAGYVAGGEATLDAIAGADHDVLSRTCRPVASRVLARALPLLAGGRGRAPLPLGVGG
jgi:squalene synthase HpnC